MATGAFADRLASPATRSPSTAAAAARGDEARAQAPEETERPERPAPCWPRLLHLVAAAGGRGHVVTAGIFGKPKLAGISTRRAVAAPAFDADYLWTPCQDSRRHAVLREVPVDPATATRVDHDVMDEVLRTVREGVPGGRRTSMPTRPNLSFVNFPNRLAGHASGRGATYEAAIGRPTRSCGGSWISSARSACGGGR